MPSFSQRSLTELETCHDELQLVAREAIEITDFSVIHGHRTQRQQNELFDKGYSKLRWPDSKHNLTPSHAVDVIPYVAGIGGITGSSEQITQLQERWNCSRVAVEREIWWQYGKLWGVFEATASSFGIHLRSGADWDSDGSILDHRFVDAGHIELV